MDFGDYLERLNLTLKAMVALEQQQGAADLTQCLARRFGEPMLRDIPQMLQRVQSVLIQAADAAE